ncbi:aminoglycoside 6'-N-acetyltransferase [Robiginitalea sp. IMCC43444]|uniref:aminoglycoside 6'-N-acetyltransferase n=1 Tax=Robiginitalea sp. IMCC43444 TaxID=3459121 RepID=UPI004042A980
MTIEEISENHIPKITDLAIKLWPGCSYEEEFANCWEILNTDRQNIFVAKAGDDIIGFIQLSLRTDYVEGTTTSPIVYIEGLYIEPSYRNQGVASRLVRKSEDWGLEQNCTEIASDAELNNTGSIDFHKSTGFREVNRIVCFSKTIRKP